MRPLGAGAAVLVVFWTTGALAQPGSLQVSTASQFLTGDALRLGGQTRVEPDLGIVWIQPGFRLGTLELNAHLVQRRRWPWLGVAFGALRDVKLGGLTWTFQGGDSAVMPSISDYGFKNLFAPRLNFAGLFAEGTSRATTVTVAAGRVTALRNIFGTDTEALDQRVAFARVRHRTSTAFEWSARASAVRTRRLGEFSFFIDESRQAGGGVRYRPLGLVELVADGALTSFRRRGAARFEQDTSALAGTLWALPRGWVQLDAQRLSPGEFPVLHNTLTDRQGVFVAGEYDVTERLRIFGGAEGFETNRDPQAWTEARQAPPRTMMRRGFGGVRTRLTSRSFLTLRAEEGRRTSQPVLSERTSDAETRLLGAEWQGTFGRWTTYGRYHRRESADRVLESASFVQHDAFAQVHVNLSRGAQIFGSGQYTRQTAAAGGENLWQATAGGQVQMPQRQLWLRAEGTLTERLDTDTGHAAERQALTVGLFGQLTRRTSISVDLLVDRSPSAVLGGSPWTTRSTLRLVHTIPTGSARVGPTEPRLTVGRPPGRGTGTIAGEVFADWNANGVRDPGEDPLAGIAVALGAVGRASSGPDGQFRFAQVPAGPARVGPDVTALPVDYDLPQPAQVDVEVARDRVSRVSFGLVPLGTVHGGVYRDANGNGRADDQDEPIDGAVVILDAGVRSELARGGAFRFDAVRSGPHRVRLLADSLPAGADIQGAAEVAVEVTRDRLDPQVTFLVRLEPRPEVRRVFPPAGVPAPAPAPVAPPVGPARPTPAASGTPTTAPPPTSPPPARSDLTVLQIAAVGRFDRAQSLVDDLRARGFDAYIVPPAPGGPDAFYRVRVGTFATRRTAEVARGALRDALKLSASARPADPARPGPFRIQVAALASLERARRLLDRLAALHYPGYLLAPGPASADGLYRVRVGPYGARDEAERAAQAIGEALGTVVWITEENPPTAAPGARRRPAPAPADPTSTAGPPRPRSFVVQVAALGERARSDALADRLRRLGYVPRVVEPVPGAPDRLFRVVVGPFGSADEARKVATAIEGALGLRVWVRPGS